MSKGLRITTINLWYSELELAFPPAAINSYPPTFSTSSAVFASNSPPKRML
ncbi:MAG: hypothetical protein QXO86_06715 [Nitrososphaerota archaeon]